MIKQIASEEIARLQAVHRDLVQDIESGKTRRFAGLRFLYIESRIKHWSKYL